MSLPKPKYDPAIHLSVVATSRNDDHGNGLLDRMQYFIDGLIDQCNRHRVTAELILVEWNPPSDKAALLTSLKWPKSNFFCDVRILTVPKSVHQEFENSSTLPLFQMIAKNVGIRRARGRHILATNIDILFSDPLMTFIRDSLKSGTLYRVNRLDVPQEMPKNKDIQEILRFCQSTYFRINTNQYTGIRSASDLKWQFIKFLCMLTPTPRRVLLHITTLTGMLCWSFVATSKSFLKRAKCSLFLLVLQKSIKISRLNLKLAIFKFIEKVCRITVNLSSYFTSILRADNRKKNLFTNACGDFTLMSREAWFSLRGYPEWPIFSWHLDSILLEQAARRGIRERFIGFKAPIYHIEHSRGSGYSPEGSNALFARLDSMKLPYLDNEAYHVIVRQMWDSGQESAIFNDVNWGLAAREFAEAEISSEWRSH